MESYILHLERNVRNVWLRGWFIKPFNHMPVNHIFMFNEAMPKVFVSEKSAASEH